LFILNHAFGFDSLRSKWNAPIFFFLPFLNLETRVFLALSELGLDAVSSVWGVGVA
jgi:hypothetical protein